MKEVPKQVSESVRRRNPHLYPPVGSLPIDSDIVKLLIKNNYTPKPPKRIRQSSKPLMNKLESRWLDFYGKRFKQLHTQGIRFKLANGVWYKPDFVCFNVMTCWEIKGPHAFRGGFENLKIAAHQYPEFKWVLCWEVSGGWKEQTVLP